MGIAVGIGYVAGVWLDNKLDTAPYMMLLMVLFGVAAAFKAVIRVARTGMPEEDKSQGASNGNGADK